MGGDILNLCQLALTVLILTGKIIIRKDKIFAKTCDGFSHKIFAWIRIFRNEDGWREDPVTSEICLLGQKPEREIGIDMNFFFLRRGYGRSTLSLIPVKYLHLRVETANNHNHAGEN